jgi:DUF3089 family protein
VSVAAIDRWTGIGVRARRRLGALVAAIVAAAALAGYAPVPASATVWLCKPSQKPDPCTPGLSTTVFSPKLKALGVAHPKPVKNPAIDCFYVYPTVSDQKTTYANFKVDPVERSIALYQAARYSQYCRVFAPMYRQVTLTALLAGANESPAELAVPPLADVRSAFRDYLAHYNDGRGFVLIGHSQGSLILRELIARDVDPKPTVRKRLLSAILMGGDVLVKTGKGTGGDFKHMPACRSDTQLGCVIAFSTFDTPVLAKSIFGISRTAGDSVLCTNPAALAGGSGILDPIFPSAPFDPASTLAVGIRLLALTQPHPKTVWSAEPGAYSARCSSANNAHVLQITALHGAQTAKPSPDGTWGLHLLDANVALGNLLAIVKSEAATFAAGNV